MKIRELRNKTEAELEKMFKEFAVKRQALEFKVAGKQLKNVRELRAVKRTIARILTLLKEQMK